MKFRLTDDEANDGEDRHLQVVDDCQGLDDLLRVIVFFELTLSQGAQFILCVA